MVCVQGVVGGASHCTRRGGAWSIASFPGLLFVEGSGNKATCSNKMLPNCDDRLDPIIHEFHPFFGRNTK